MLCNLPFRIVTVSALILNLAADPRLLSAQQAPADVPTITIRANTRLVVVDVVVTHKKGQPVTGLKPEDFTLEENGKKQKVSVFVPPGTANHTASTPAPAGVLSNHAENVSPGWDSDRVASRCGELRVQGPVLRTFADVEVCGGAGANRPSDGRADANGSVARAAAITSDPQVLITAIKNVMLQEQILQPGAPAAGSAWRARRTQGAAMASAIVAQLDMATANSIYRCPAWIRRRASHPDYD